MAMTLTFTSAVVALWVAFYSFWLISAIGVKKAARATPWGKAAGIRILMVIIVVLIVREPRTRHLLLFRSSSLPLQLFGLILCVAGLAFAVWARLHLGRNWGIPMSLKEGHELITSGPYRFVRHPIYTGILLALLGSGLADGKMWLLGFFVSCPFFVFSARTEERLMTQRFPDQYPEYKNGTSALIPFVW
jgi:protein-S-isoprenylcysteine O-methyltransferase Ste14